MIAVETSDTIGALAVLALLGLALAWDRWKARRRPAPSRYGTVDNSIQCICRPIGSNLRSDMHFTRCPLYERRPRG